MKFGAIDIGTNAVRLLIGEVVKEENTAYVKKVSYTRIPLRLGMDVFSNSIISDQKKEDFIDAMQAFSHVAKMFKVKALRACATSAMREAANADEVISAVEAATGIRIEVISGDEEARLIFGTFFLLRIDKSSPFVVVDVGGGSTEINVFEKGNRVACKSFEIGTIRMLKNKTKPNVWKEIQKWIAQNIDPKHRHTVYATGGNINKINKMIGKDKEGVRVEKLSELHQKLKTLSVKEREDQYKLNPDRADVIVPACQIFEFIFREMKTNKVLVPKIGLSDGIVYDLYLQHQEG